jgi:2-amino-4-hydroxy-6-hydroxymethyldihydropteridine diphosphokinase
MANTPPAKPLVDAFIAVGSNINPQENIPRAMTILNAQLSIIAISNFYKTAAVGTTAQPDFLNGVVKIKTAHQPREIKFDILRKIETCLGRVRTADKFAPRTIDLDLILYGMLVVDEPDLHIPDPAIRTYPFVASPLFELAPNLILPDTGNPLSTEPVTKLKTDLHLESDFTTRLRCLILP